MQALLGRNSRRAERRVGEGAEFFMQHIQLGPFVVFQVLGDCRDLALVAALLDDLASSVG